MNLGEATRLYQAAREELRRDPDDEHVKREVEQAREAMEVAWLSEKLTLDTRSDRL